MDFKSALVEPRVDTLGRTHSVSADSTLHRSRINVLPEGETTGLIVIPGRLGHEAPRGESRVRLSRNYYIRASLRSCLPYEVAAVLIYCHIETT